MSNSATRIVASIFGVLAGLLGAAKLLIMAVITALTGARCSMVFFKICPLVKIIAIAALLLLFSTDL